MRNIKSFNPTLKTSDTFQFIVSNGGWLVVINESPVGLLMTFGGGRVVYTIPPNFLRAIPVDEGSRDVEWSQEYLLPTSQSPISLVIGECWEKSEWTLGPIMLALPRQFNLGNPTISGGSMNIVNDGNPANTQVVEATQVGASGSNALLDNSGNLTLKEWTGTILNRLFGTVANVAAGATNVFLGKVGNFFTEVLGNLKVDGTTTLLDVLFPKATTPNSAVYQIGLDFSNGAQIGTFGSAAMDIQVISNGNTAIKGAKVVLQGISSGVDFQNNLGTTVFFVDTTGAITVGSVPVARIAAGDLGSGVNLGGGLIKNSGGSTTGSSDSAAVFHLGTDDAGTKRTIAIYIGTTDPAGRAGVTVNEGDIWFKV